MDVLAMLKRDHEEIRTLVKAVAEAKGVKSRREAFGTCEMQLRVRLELEKDYLYPEVTGLFPGSDHAIKVGMAGGQAIKRKLTQMGKVIAGPINEQSDFAGKWDKLLESVEKHFSTQEELLMPRMRGAIRTEEREDLGELFQEVRQEIAENVGGSGTRAGGTRRRA